MCHALRVSNPSRTVSVALLALPEASGAVLYGIREVLAAVGTTWETVTGERTRGPRMSARLLAAAKEPSVCATGVPVAPDAVFADGERFDVAIVPDLAVDMDFGLPCWGSCGAAQGAACK